MKFVLLSFVISHIITNILAKDPVIKTYYDRSVYTLSSDNVRHLIPDWSTFVSMGYDVGEIRTLKDEEMNAIPIGKEASAIVEAPTIENPLKDCPCISDAAYAHSLETHEHKTHLLCLVENKNSAELLRIYDHKLLNIAHRVVSQDVLKTYGYTSKVEGTEEMKGCDVILNLVDSEFMGSSRFDKYICPEMCLPVPYVEMPLNWLLDTVKQDPEEISGSVGRAVNHSDTSALTPIHARALTCTLTYAEIWKDPELLEHHRSRGSGSGAGAGTGTLTARRRLQDGAGAGTGTTGTGAVTHTHKSLGLVLKAIVQRRFEECNEQHLWPSGAAGSATTAKAIPARKVFGLVIWIGSRSRYDLLASQIEVLRNQSTDPNIRVMGWLASEDQYDCRVGTSLCYNANNLNAYFPLMPSTRMNVASAGWSCAQRRQLRSLQHTLLLFDPQFMLVVDDDTYVNSRMLSPGGKLDAYIRTELAHSNYVLGELTLGRKVTQKGFYWGGAGYLFGRPVIESLNSYVMHGPSAPSDSMRDESKTRDLSVMKQTYEQSLRVCPTCFTLQDPDKNIQKDNNNYFDIVGATANTTARAIEICTNLMSQEHTCFHSDHAMSRCLLHGVNGYPVHIACTGSNVGNPNVFFGMCMATDFCGDDHLTCHRFYPLPGNALVAKGQYVRRK
jgi:hypothetical protein